MDTNTDPVRALIAKWQAAPYGNGDHDYYVDALRACARELEAALAQQPSSPSGEAVAYRWRDRGTMQMVYSDTNPGYCNVEPLYTAPQQPAAPSGEAVAEVVEFYGLRAVSWIGTGAAPGLPVGTKLYAAPQQPAGVDGMVMVQASDLKALAEFADRGMRGNPAKLAALRAKAILAANRQEGE